MAMSNAEKQEAWRQRQRAKLDTHFKELEATIARQAAEITRLQARLAVKTPAFRRAKKQAAKKPGTAKSLR
jgi:hypothetical protein